MSTTQLAPEISVTAMSAASSQRLLSVDVLRGLCVAGMVLVNFPSDWILRYRQLAHAEWNGATATDMIFPCFLFLAGFSMALSFRARSQQGESRSKLARHLVVRSLTLIVLGILLDAFPRFDWHFLHMPGVLQRIALCSLAGGLFVLDTARSPERIGANAIGANHDFMVHQSTFTINVLAVAALMLAVLAGVWALSRFLPVPGYGAWRFEPNGYLGAVIDRAIFGNQHLSNWGGPARMWDADGLLSSITSIPNLLLGMLAAEWIRTGQERLHESSSGKTRPTSKTRLTSETRPTSKTLSGMLIVAAVLVLVALLLNPYLPINRKIWTDSFTLLSSGVSLGLFTVFYALLDLASIPWLRRIAKPALVYGSNAILGYALYCLLLGLHSLYRFRDAHGNAHWISGSAYDRLSGVINPWNTSVIYGLGAVVLVWVLLWPFYRMRIFLRL